MNETPPERTITDVTAEQPEVDTTPQPEPATEDELHPSTPGIPGKGQHSPQSMTP